MRPFRLFLISGLAGSLLALMAPVSVTQAQIRLPGLGNPIASVLHGFGRVLRLRRHRAYHRRHVSRAAIRAARATSAKAVAKQAGTTLPLTAGALFWPGAYDDLFRYAFSTGDNPQAIWAHGYGDVLAALFANANADANASVKREPTKVATADETNGGAMTRNASPAACENDPAQTNERISNFITQTIDLNDRQRAAFDALRKALTTAGDAMRTACINDIEARGPDRLRSMTNRLWTAHVAGYLVRDPLAKFYAVLTPEQKTKLDTPAKADDAPDSQKTAQPDANPRLCMAMAMRGADWPVRALEEKLNLQKKQRAGMAMVDQLSERMEKSILASCPPKQPRNLLARFDAGLDRLDALFYAANILHPAIEGFYGSLSENQQQRFEHTRFQ